MVSAVGTGSHGKEVTKEEGTPAVAEVESRAELGKSLMVVGEALVTQRGGHGDDPGAVLSG